MSEDTFDKLIEHQLPALRQEARDYIRRMRLLPGEMDEQKMRFAEALLASRPEGGRTVGGRAIELLALIVGAWDEEQSKRTQSIADEPWHIAQSRKLLNDGSKS